MNAGPEAQEVQVDVLPPLPKDAASVSLPAVPSAGQPPPFAGLRTFYHPASGVIILGLDWFAFGTDIMTDLLALPIVSILFFLISFPLVYIVQKKWSRDTTAAALGKAFLGAVMVGLPFPITGTLLGGAILALAGLPHHPVEMVRKLTSQTGTATK